MAWSTSESPLPQVEIHPCDKNGCRALARNHFLSVQTKEGILERRVAKRCDVHAEELRATIEKRAVAVSRAPKPTPEQLAAAASPAPVHHCHAIGCQVVVAPRLLMCPAHWRKVPKKLQDQVWAEYRPGQEIDKRPTSAYLEVMEAAIAAVAMADAKPKRPPQLFEIPEHHTVTTCTSCASAIVFVQTRDGKRMPVEPYGDIRGQSHFIHCPNADAHRGPR